MRKAYLLSFALILLPIGTAAAGPQSSDERDVKIPVSGVKEMGGEVLIDIAYEAKMIEVVETLQKDVTRLLKKAAEEFPGSTAIRLLVSNRGERICELEIPTEIAAKGAANVLDDEAMLDQMKSEVFVDIRGRIAAEQKPGEWPRFSPGTFDEQMLASETEDEWKALEVRPEEEADEAEAVGAGERLQGETESGDQEQGQTKESGGSGKTAVVVGLIALVVVLGAAAALIFRRRWVR